MSNKVCDEGLELIQPKGAKPRVLKCPLFHGVYMHQRSAREGRLFGPTGLASAMAMGDVVQPSPTLEENKRKGISSLGEGEG